MPKRIHLQQRPPAESGATATEYAIMVALIAIAIFSAVVVFGQQVTALFFIPANTF